MKRIVTAMLSAVALSACSDDPTGSGAGRYDLVEYFGNPIPVSVTLQLPGDPPPACSDTLYAGYIELDAGSSGARQVFRYVHNCSGPRTLTDEERTGTYEMNGDTVNLTWHIDNDLISTFSESAIIVGDQLRIPYTVYTEADPDGETTYTIYQR